MGLGLNLSTRRTRKRKFLEEMERVVPWSAQMQVVEPHYPTSKTGRPPFCIATMLRIHFLQHWFGLSDPAIEETLYDVPVYREFAKLEGVADRLPDETTILRFRHLLERHDLAADMLRVVNNILQAKGRVMRKGTVVDATLISAPSSTKNAEGERDSDMHQTKKGNNWYFGMKAHVHTDFSREEIDVDIRYGQSQWPDLHVETVFEEEVLPLISPKLKEKLNLRSPEELLFQNLILSNVLVQWPQWFAAHGVPISPSEYAVSFDRAYLSIQAAVQGLGIALESDRLAEDALGRGLLVPVFPYRKGMQIYGHHLVCPPPHAEHRKVKLFVAWIRGEV